MFLKKIRQFFLKRKIRKLFVQGKITIKTVSENGKIEYKKIKDVLKHFTIIKTICEVKFANNKKVTVTEDHNLFSFDKKLQPMKPIDLKQAVYILNDTTTNIDVEVEKADSRNYMYDLVVEDNHNFVLTNGILVCNSFSPPSNEQAIAGFTQTRGYRWPDFQLYSHLVQAVNFVNLVPPDTNFSIVNFPAVWQPLMLMQAMSYALWDLAILWINEEFSYSLNGISLDISRSDKYQSAASTLQDQVNQQLEIAKRRIHITKGLAQSRYTFARSAALGPWTGGQNIKRWVMGSSTVRFGGS